MRAVYLDQSSSKCYSHNATVSQVQPKRLGLPQIDHSALAQVGLAIAFLHLLDLCAAALDTFVLAETTAHLSPGLNAAT